MTDEIATKLLDYAMDAGAEAADILASRSVSSSAGIRLGELEELERAESSGVGLRVFIGKRQGIASGSDVREASLKKLAERALAIAKLAPEDEFCGLADREKLSQQWPALKLLDVHEPAPEWMLDQCRAMEDAARAPKGITNSEGASAGYGRSDIHLVTSDGFDGAYSKSSFSLSACVLAGEGSKMERDYAYSTKRFCNALPSAESIGQEAAERTLKRLNPKRVKTGKFPVMFDKRISKQILASFVGAISGSAIARGTSFLKNEMHKPVFHESISIFDDPHVVSGLGSRPFDGEGCTNNALNLIDKGVLNHWLLDSRCARQLGLQSNGRASRGLSSAPSPSSTNLTMKAGEHSVEALLKQMGTGFFVTDTFGMGINLITGDYSQGASGFWVEKGEIAYAVSEITIASTLQEMFKNLTAANDLTFDYATNAPSLLVEHMTIAGD